jgi:NhaP-type Na+/H+ or K+/H+ antiporter
VLCRVLCRSILLFAVLGTVVSTFVVGFLVYGFARAGVVNVATDSPLQSLLFGALISAGNFIDLLWRVGPTVTCSSSFAV